MSVLVNLSSFILRLAQKELVELSMVLVLTVQTPLWSKKHQVRVLR